MIGKQEKGFTLIEVLIAISIIGIIFTSIANSNITGFRVWNFNQEKIDVQQVGRIILARIGPYIRSTTEIDTTSLPDELHIKFPTRTDGNKDYNGMTFGVKNSGEFFYRKHYTDGSNSNRMSITSSNNIIVKDLMFSYNSNKQIVGLEFTLEKNFIDDYIVIDRIYLRNTEIKELNTP